MDFAAAGTDLEQQAAQLLLKLQVTSNPAFSDTGEGTTDEELMIRADPFAAAARRVNTNFVPSGGSNIRPSSLSISTFSPNRNAPIEEFAAAATNSARAATANLLAATDPNISNNSYYHDYNHESSLRPGDHHYHHDHSHYHLHHSSASFEVEAFRAALKQQRAPSLRLLVAVSKTAVPALMCVLCNAQPFIHSFDEFCSGGRFDSLYYDAKFRSARDNEKHKKKERELRIEERRHCLFAPRTRDEIGAELIARKRGEAYVDPKEEALAAKEAALIDGRNRSLFIPRSAAGENSSGSSRVDDSVPRGASEEGTREGNSAKRHDSEAAEESIAAAKAPDAFFVYNMQWKDQRKKKMEKKIAKLLKEREEEDEETFRQWQMSEASRKLADVYKAKKERGLLPAKEKPLQYTFQPSITPFRSTRNPESILQNADVVERLLMDTTKRKEDQILREIDQIGKYRAKTPRLTRLELSQVVAELNNPTPKTTTTFRKPMLVETPTFSPKISRGPNPSALVATRASAAATKFLVSSPSSSSASPSDQSRERHSRRCIQPYAVAKVQQRYVSMKPVTDVEASNRYRRDLEEMRLREERLQEIRDDIERKQAALCTFRNGDLVLTSRTDELSSRFYSAVEDSLINRRMLTNHETDRTSSSTKVSPAASPFPKGDQRLSPRRRKQPTEFSPPHLTPTRRLVIPHMACPTSSMSPERRTRRYVPNLHDTTAEVCRTSLSTTMSNRTNNWNQNSSEATRTITNPADQQMILQYLSEEFNRVASARSRCCLLPISPAAELCHRIAVEKQITVHRLLSSEDMQLIFPAVVGFVDFVRMFELMVGRNLTDDFL